MMFKFKPSKLTLAMVSCGLLTFPGAIYAQEVDEKEASTLVWYPKAVYFYVGNNQPSLAKSIKTGLELALKDGSFKKLFMSYYGEIISTLQKEHRQVFKLTNPLLSPLTPLDRPELWLDLSPANKVNN